jgi:hypothetical protein
MEFTMLPKGIIYRSIILMTQFYLLQVRIQMDLFRPLFPSIKIDMRRMLLTPYKIIKSNLL